MAAGGEATVFAADALNADGDQAIVETFRLSRDADYARLERDGDQLLTSARTARKAGAPSREQLHRAVRALRERFAAIERMDFCNAHGRQGAAEVLARLERRLAEPGHRSIRANASPQSAAAFRNRRWVTRPRPGVDRMASAWLIRRFIDPRATFAFVDQSGEADVPFDMYTGEFSHQGSLCTFETLAERFSLRNDAVDRLGHIVHDLDMKDTHYAMAEGPAVDRMVEGLQRMHTDDHVLLEQGIAMFEALARSFESGAQKRESPRRVRRPKSKRPRHGPKRR